MPEVSLHIDKSVDNITIRVVWRPDQVKNVIEQLTQIRDGFSITQTDNDQYNTPTFTVKNTSGADSTLGELKQTIIDNVKNTPGAGGGNLQPNQINLNGPDDSNIPAQSGTKVAKKWG